MSVNDASASIAIGKERRRSWSQGQKRVIVEEAFRPGASVADIARQHGLNANQVFNWRRTMLARSSAAKKAAPPLGHVTPDEIGASAGFMPVGIIVQTDDGATSVSLPPASATISAAASEQALLDRQAMAERGGLIRIDLAGGTRLLVDAFVNERALRRVLSVLQAVS